MDTTGQAGPSARIHGAPNGLPMKCGRKVQGRFRCRLPAEAASGHALRALREQITSSEEPPSYYWGSAKLDTMKTIPQKGISSSEISGAPPEEAPPPP